jgi:Zn-dependent protease
LHFALFGTPVRVHPLFWIVAILLGLNGTRGQPLPMLTWVVAVFLAILVHEFGHALAAQAFGWPAHITLYGMGGLASYRPTRRLPGRILLITLAGPAAGFLFAALIMLGIRATGRHLMMQWDLAAGLPVTFEGFDSLYLTWLLEKLLFINIFWGLVNLLPVYPLDGGQIAREALGLVGSSDNVRQSLWLSVIVGAAVAVFAWLRMKDFYIALFFAYLAYSSFVTLQTYFGRGSGFGGGRP